VYPLVDELDQRPVDVDESRDGATRPLSGAQFAKAADVDSA